MSYLPYNLIELKKQRESINEAIESDWEHLQGGFENKIVNSIQYPSLNLVSELRSQAILDYLINGNTFDFFNSCYHSACVYCNFNNFSAMGMPSHQDCYQLGESNGFFSSILTFRKNNFKEIIQALPAIENSNLYIQRVSGYFIDALSALLLGYDDIASRRITDLQILHDKFNIDTSIEVTLCESLSTKNQVATQENIIKYLDRYTQSTKDNASLGIAEELISINGLALIRIANILGIDTKIEHPLAPVELQNTTPDQREFVNKYLVGVADYPAMQKNKNYWDEWK